MERKADALDAGLVEPGDLVLVKSRGWVSAAGRRLGGNPYDHVAIVVGGGQTVNVDKPSTRLLPAARLLRARLEPLILRPQWPSPQARAEFVRCIEGLAGREYDVARTLRLIVTLLLRRFANVTWRLPRADVRQTRWICTDAVMLGLERFAAHAERLRELPLDWNALGCATTNDFLTIAAERPETLRRIAP